MVLEAHWDHKQDHHRDPRDNPSGNMVVLVILMTKLVIGGDFYEERYCKWSRMHSKINKWV